MQNLTDLLIKKGHDVSVLNLPKRQLPNGFNEKIHLVELSGRAKLWNLSYTDIKQAKFFSKIKLCFLGFIKKLLNRNETWHKLIFKKTFLSGYDVAIGFRQSPLCFWFIKHKTDANTKKIGFWHGSLPYMGDLSGWDYTLKYLDKLACVSDAVKNEILLKYPFMSGKVFTVYNVFNSDIILAESKKFDAGYDKSIFNIVTVARIDFDQKQLNYIPYICRALIDNNVKFKWTIVGDGADMNNLETLMSSNGVSDYIELTGSKSNPFPYIRQADLFVLTSKCESYGMVVVESLICNTPVVAAEYPALKEILEDGVYGLIADNSINGLTDAIYKMYSDKQTYNKIKDNCNGYKYSSNSVYKQFMDMVELNA